jgi:hypothetical protein
LILPWAARLAGACIASLAMGGDRGVAQGAEQPLYLVCAPSADVDVDAGDPVMVDRDAGLVVWMERLGDGTWRRTTYQFVARTPREVTARAEHAVAVWTFEREWALPRSENRKVWDAHRERMGYPEAVQLYAGDQGACRPVPGGGYGLGQ